MAHPLNRPRFDPATRPGRARATASSSRGSRRRCRPSATRSIYQRVFSGPAGIDPYASAVSDVYQDLFGEGSFTGKGIYDVDAFERGARRSRPGERAAEPRPLRGHVRARRARDRHRALRRVPLELPGRGRPPASLGARRLAAPAVDPRPRARRVRPPRPQRRCPASLAGRWSTTSAGRSPRPFDARDPGRRPGSCPAIAAAVWTGVRAGDRRRPRRAARRFRACRPRRQGISKRSHLRAVGADVAVGASPGRARPGAPRPPGLAHGRRDRPDAGAACTSRHRDLLEWTTAAQAKATRSPRASRVLPAGWPVGVGDRGQSRGLLVLALDPAAALDRGAVRRRAGSLSPAIARWISLPPRRAPDRSV